MDVVSTVPDERTEARPGRRRFRSDPGAPISDPGAPTLGNAARRLGTYVWAYRWSVALAIGCFFGAAATEPIAPALLKYLVDHGFQHSARFPLWSVPIIVVALFLVRGIAGFAGTYLFAWSTSKVVLALRRDLVRAIVRADSTLYTSLSPGVATARVINEPQNAVGALSQAITTVLRDGISFVVLLGYLFYLNWRLTVISLAITPLVMLVMKRVRRRVIHVGSRTYESQVRLTGIIDDIARAWRVVRTFDAGEFEEGRFAAEAKRLCNGTVKSAAAGAMTSPLTQIVASMGVAVILTISLWQARHGHMSVGDFVAFITTLLMTSTPLRRLTDITTPIITSLIQARACFELMDARPEPDTGTQELERAKGELQFERLTVVHAGADRPALCDVSLRIPAGRTIAIVGPSGAGKTTLINTLLGFVPPASGSARIDGIDLHELRKVSLRRQFAVVSQDIVLFDASIEANVVYAQPLDPQRVQHCLRAAQLWDFVTTLPEGVHTRVGTNGNRLSGGQRQRLAIARALYKDAPVWIFDEATSALDSESEQAVHEGIARQRGTRTLILIAHRLSTIRHADCIYVVDDGRVVERGTHATLLAANSRYAAMVRAQALH